MGFVSVEKLDYVTIYCITVRRHVSISPDVMVGIFLPINTRDNIMSLNEFYSYVCVR